MLFIVVDGAQLAVDTPPMDRQSFCERFRSAAAQARGVALTMVGESLPEAMVFRLRLNSSYDGDPLQGDEHIYPEDSSSERARSLLACTEDVVVSTLWRDGAVPEWVSVEVLGETGRATLIEVAASGRFTADDERLFPGNQEQPPFEVHGPAPPADHENGYRFSVHHRSECWSVKELSELSRNASKVRSLDLIGHEFNDHVLRTLPELPSLEALELQDSPIDGSGLGALKRYPKLRALEIHLLNVQRFAVGELPKIHGLESLIILGLPHKKWGFDSLAAKLPELSSLSLQSFGDLVLDGQCPSFESSLGSTVKRLARLQSPRERQGFYLSLEARRLTVLPSLPKRLHMASLHLSEQAGPDIEKLLASVHHIESLHLRGTPMDEATLRRLISKLRPGQIDVVDTGIDEEAMRRIAAQNPGTKVQHESVSVF